MRSGLVALLGFCDDHPSWARLLVLEAPLSAGVTLECRQQLHDVLARLLDHHAAGWRPGGSPQPTPALTDELIVGGVFSVIRTSMLEGSDGKLVELAPSLMAFIVAPYLGQAAAHAELRADRPASRGDGERARLASAGDIPRGRASGARDASHDARAARDRASAVLEQPRGRPGRGSR